jgi:hypothetical protein
LSYFGDRWRLALLLVGHTPQKIGAFAEQWLSSSHLDVRRPATDFLAHTPSMGLAAVGVSDGRSFSSTFFACTARGRGDNQPSLAGGRSGSPTADRRFFSFTAHVQARRHRTTYRRRRCLASARA